MNDDSILTDADTGSDSSAASPEAEEQTSTVIDYTDLLTSIDTKLDNFVTIDTFNNFVTHLDGVVLNCVYLAIVLFFVGACRWLVSSIRKGEKY